MTLDTKKLMEWQIDSFRVSNNSLTKTRMGEHFCLKWNNHQENFTGTMIKLLDEQKFVDVSLVCEMKTFKAHQTVLSACSPYFEQVLEDNKHPHPIIILRDVKQAEMSALLQYMYRGEVNVRDDELTKFLQTAQALQVRGLSDNKQEQVTTKVRENTPTSPTSNQSKRRRRSSSTIDSSPNDKVYTDTLHTAGQSVNEQAGSTTNHKNSVNLSHTTNPRYTDTSEMQYLDLKTSSHSIKQEDTCSVTDDIYHGISQHSQGTQDYHRRESLVRHSPQDVQQNRDWNVDYEPSSSHHYTNTTTSYPQQQQHPSTKVELPKVPTQMTHSFSLQLQGSTIPPPVPALFPCSKTKPPKKDVQSYESSSLMTLKTKCENVQMCNQSVIQPVRGSEQSDILVHPGIQRKGGRFRPGWMENYSWLQYDENLNTMFCRTCRKWSNSVPDIRTSFVEGNGNFRLEIVNHHDKSKAHKLCMAKEIESIPRLDPIISSQDTNQ